jgi:hypothetical protein
VDRQHEINGDHVKGNDLAVMENDGMCAVSDASTASLRRSDTIQLVRSVRSLSVFNTPYRALLWIVLMYARMSSGYAFN